MYRAAIEYYTELIQKFEEWIKYLKNGGNSNLVESFLERENIRGAEDINYNTRPSSNRITNLKVKQTFIEEEDNKLKEVEKTQQVKAITAYSTLIGLNSGGIVWAEVEEDHIRKAVNKYYELIDTIKEYKEEAQRRQEETQRRQEETQRRQEEAQRRQEEAQRRQEEAQREHIELIEPYLKKLIQSEKYNHWCIYKDGKYIWSKEFAAGTKLAIFLIVVYRKIKNDNIPSKFFEEYFGVKNISQLAHQIDDKEERVTKLKEYLMKD